MAQVSSTKCNVCNDNIGQLYCYECEQVLCQKCKNLHDKFTPNKAHTVIDVHKEGRRLFKPKPVCVDHQKEYSHYCKSCECLTCGECITSGHNGHKFCDYMEVVDRHKQQISDMASDLKTKVKVIDGLINTIKADKLAQVKCDSKSFLQKVNSTSTTFHQAIDSVKTYYETTVSDYECMESDKIETVLEKLKHLHKSYTDISLRIENVLLEKHGITFLFEQKSIQKEKENLDEIPDVPEPIRIQNFDISSFTDQVLGKVQEACNISTMWEVVPENGFEYLHKCPECRYEKVFPSYDR